MKLLMAQLAWSLWSGISDLDCQLWSGTMCRILEPYRWINKRYILASSWYNFAEFAFFRFLTETLHHQIHEIITNYILRRLHWLCGPSIACTRFVVSLSSFQNLLPFGPGEGGRLTSLEIHFNPLIVHWSSCLSIFLLFMFTAFRVNFSLGLPRTINR